jgi:hypothetical protein
LAASDLLERLASAVVSAEDVFVTPFDSTTLFARLSPQDRIVLINIARRIEEIESDRGTAAAEAILAGVLRTLATDRPSV